MTIKFRNRECGKNCLIFTVQFSLCKKQTVISYNSIPTRHIYYIVERTKGHPYKSSHMYYYKLLIIVYKESKIIDNTPKRICR